jgi:hypothetical protein
VSAEVAPRRAKRKKERAEPPLGLKGIVPLRVDPEEAAYLIGSEKLLRRVVAAGWLKPSIQSKRLTRYRTVDVEACVEPRRPGGLAFRGDRESASISESPGWRCRNA